MFRKQLSWLHMSFEPDAGMAGLTLAGEEIEELDGETDAPVPCANEGTIDEGDEGELETVPMGGAVEMAATVLVDFAGLVVTTWLLGAVELEPEFPDEIVVMVAVGLAGGW